MDEMICHLVLKYISLIPHSADLGEQLGSNIARCIQVINLKAYKCLMGVECRMRRGRL